jgi:hypothetical protein
MVYVPAVTVLTDVPEPELLPPQPVSPIPIHTTATADNMTGKRFFDSKAVRITVREKKQSTVRDPKVAGARGVDEMFAPLAGVVVVTSNVAVEVPPGLSVTLVGLMVQVAFAGAPEQARLTELLNVAFADSIRAATALCPGLTEVDCGLAESVNAGVSAVTAKDTAVELLGLKLPSPLKTAVML